MIHSTSPKLIPGLEITSCRPTTRVFVFDADGRIGVVLRKKPSTFFLPPGGGVDEGETLEDSARRECLEEMGAVVGKLEQFGYSENQLPNGTLIQAHYFSASLIEMQTQTTTDHRELGQEVRWLDPKEYLTMLENYLEEGDPDEAPWTKYWLEHYLR